MISDQKLLALICTQCGAPLDKTTMSCPYCRTEFLTLESIVDKTSQPSPKNPERTHYNTVWGEKEIGSMKVGEQGFAVGWAIDFDEAGIPYLNLKYPVEPNEGGTAEVPIRRFGSGQADFEVDVRGLDYEWTKSDVVPKTDSPRYAMLSSECVVGDPKFSRRIKDMEVGERGYTVGWATLDGKSTFTVDFEPGGTVDTLIQRTGPGMYDFRVLESSKR